MIRRSVATALLLAALTSAFAGDATAARLTSVGVSEATAVPQTRPRWPTPSDPNQQFYIQRSTNRNAVVYAARFRADGTLDPRAPIRVYWRRFAEKGQAKPLKWIEGPLYGVAASANGDAGDEYLVWLRNLPELRFLVRQAGPGRAETLVRIGGRWARPVYAFAEVDQSGLVDRVTEISLHGVLVEGGGAISERFRVSGGLVRR